MPQALGYVARIDLKLLGLYRWVSHVVVQYPNRDDAVEPKVGPMILTRKKQDCEVICVGIGTYLF